jgi:hypothetical protein
MFGDVFEDSSKFWRPLIERHRIVGIVIPDLVHLIGKTFTRLS